MDSQGAGGGVSNVKVVNRWMDKPGSWGGGVSNVKVVNTWMDKPGSWGGGKQCKSCQQMDG